MLMRFVFLVSCLFLASSRCESLTGDRENSNKLFDSGWRCDTVCAGSGGRAEFNLENKICKCKLERDVDDIDINLILKNAAASGLHFLIVEKEKTIEKRQADTNNDLTDESVVGAGRFVLPTLKPHKLVLPTKNAAGAFTKKKAKILFKKPVIKHSLKTQMRMKEIEKRIADMRRAMARNTLQLGQRANFPVDPKADLLKQIKDKHEELLEKIRSASTLHSNVPKKIITSPIIGLPNDVVEQTSVPILQPPNKPVSNIKPDISGTNQKFEIITQDPSLYKNDK